MFQILTTTILACTSALEPAHPIQLADGEARDVVQKYIKNIPDIENQYVVNEKLSKAISRLFNGKISMLPLYKISLKIDRNPIKIPWTLQSNHDKKSSVTVTNTEINTK